MSLATTGRALSAEQLQSYHENGFLIVRGLFDADEVASLGSEATTLFGRSELIDTQNIRCRWQNHADTDECRFDCFDPVIDIGPVCRYFAYDRRLLDVLRAIYDDEAHLFKDKLIFKPPLATGYALHQDFIGWKEFPESFITVIVPLDETTAANGATEVFPGYHKQGYLSPRDGEYHQLADDKIDFSTGVLLEMQPGDVALFGGFTPHRSGANRTDQWRRQLYLSYNAGRDGGEQRDAHYRQFHDWLTKKYAEYGKTGVWFK
ncbi:phytanoyl-CoA dioxygenase family protein [Anatilimnocola floriformis]|uniref:phytanoyl-CoA dioxygenase family protein n=1 Tax=Anatilimnocola floriformis TaxID=2948575 RepID=UPI0020C44DD6|nr:phytanoyl-CoA dioxygenase family protein [Anatilimnocola floriformis]